MTRWKSFSVQTRREAVDAITQFFVAHGSLGTASAAQLLVVGRPEGTVGDEELGDGVDRLAAGLDGERFPAGHGVRERYMGYENDRRWEGETQAPSGGWPPSGCGII